MSFSAATSGQIVVPASRLLVYRLEALPNPTRSIQEHESLVTGPMYTSAW
jgi:hypothetical protein